MRIFFKNVYEWERGFLEERPGKEAGGVKETTQGCRRCRDGHPPTPSSLGWGRAVGSHGTLTPPGRKTRLPGAEGWAFTQNQRGASSDETKERSREPVPWPCFCKSPLPHVSPGCLKPRAGDAVPALQPASLRGSASPGFPNLPNLTGFPPAG